MRIAALDDDPILLELIKATTEQHGHVCHTYLTGTQLLRDIRQETFDLLIVDWHLPDMEGPEVVSAVRQTTGRHLPILFVTRRREEQDVIEALSCGADDFMTKPLRMGELMARATALLRRACPQARHRRRRIAGRARQPRRGGIAGPRGGQGYQGRAFHAQQRGGRGDVLRHPQSGRDGGEL